ncbi:uncharacterized mitochondrial protein AtMg00810-like [Lactuca sativa]|uniref:uncharacterized mitochondrial protein AtMg00810-like n=1 Tax=Lactuca sativa TaxID=4236 RepID=UPI000CD9215F|nr:uncharacterized mitochondrial protein AtMg00810-like [Lactuca sativa]
MALFDHYKARVVAQGFSQILGVDYLHTFSPVVKASAMHVVLPLVVINGWSLHQLDINNAFLHDTLTDPVYMEQTPGKGVSLPKEALKKRSFTRQKSQADPSMFVFKRDLCVLYLLVYVDDLILTGNDDTVIRSIINRLHHEFLITDLGRLFYFLRIEATYTTNGLFPSQTTYAHDILDRAGLLDPQPDSTPLASNMAFVIGGDAYLDPSHYRSLVGALQYLKITRPNISYVVNQVSKFLQGPTIPHYQAVKRLMRYVKGTISFGLSFSKPTYTTLVGYSDADWARCLETRRSTYGYSIFLGGNLVS